MVNTMSCGRLVVRALMDSYPSAVKIKEAFSRLIGCDVVHILERDNGYNVLGSVDICTCGGYVRGGDELTNEILKTEVTIDNNPDIAEHLLEGEILYYTFNCVISKEPYLRYPL